MVNRQSSNVLKFNRQPSKKVIFYTLSKHKKTLNLAWKGQDNLQNT